jgi:hypothetical protein
MFVSLFAWKRGDATVRLCGIEAGKLESGGSQQAAAALLCSITLNLS